MNVYETLRQAIETKQPCSISKPGEPSRSICPYRIGTSAKYVTNIVYYQFGGFTKQAGGLEPDGSTANWRCNNVASLSSAEIIGGRWHEPIVKPKTKGHCVVNAAAEVAY
jgi:hypothetical protein